MTATQGRKKICQDTFQTNIDDYVKTLTELHYKELKTIREILGFNKNTKAEKSFWKKAMPLSLQSQQIWIYDVAKVYNITEKGVCEMLPQLEEYELKDYLMNNAAPKQYKHLQSQFLWWNYWSNEKNN